MTLRVPAACACLAALALLAEGCGSRPGGQPRTGAVRLNGAGATFPYPLYSKWFSEYEKVAPQVRVEYQSIGSGGGIQQLKAGTVDFGASDVPLSDDEAKAMPGPVLHIPTVAGAVAVIYSLPGMGGELRLDGETLAAMYLGEITAWNDRRIAALNPGLALPSLPIVVIHRSDGSGTTAIFAQYLAAISTTWASRVGAGKALAWPLGLGAKGNEGVSGMVKQTAGGIGYVELAYAVQSELAVASIRNQAGSFVRPTVASTTAAAAGAAEALARDVRASIVNSPAPDAYPIAGFTYLLVYRDQQDRAKGEALGALLDWAVHDGQAFAEPLHYAPLPPAVVKLNEAAIETMSVSGKAR